MKITVGQLRRVIKEEIMRTIRPEGNLHEGWFSDLFSKTPDGIPKGKWDLAKDSIPSGTSKEEIAQYAEWLRQRMKTKDPTKPRGNLEKEDDGLGGKSKFSNFKLENRRKADAAARATAEKEGKARREREAELEYTKSKESRPFMIWTKDSSGRWQQRGKIIATNGRDAEEEFRSKNPGWKIDQVDSQDLKYGGKEPM